MEYDAQYWREMADVQRRLLQKLCDERAALNERIGLAEELLKECIDKERDTFNKAKGDMR